MKYYLHYGISKNEGRYMEGFSRFAVEAFTYYNGILSVLYVDGSVEEIVITGFLDSVRLTKQDEKDTRHGDYFNDIPQRDAYEKEHYPLTNMRK